MRLESTMKDIIIVCEDLFGLEVYDIVMQINHWNISHHRPPKYNVLGYISTVEEPFGNVAHHLKKMGSVDDWTPVADEEYALAIKIPEHKPIIVNTLKSKGCKFGTIVASWVLTQPLDLGEGCIIAAYSIKPDIFIGKYVVMVASIIAAHHIGNYSTILRFSNVIGDVGECAYIRNHVFTYNNMSVGKGCKVDDGSVVVKSVKPGFHVAGVPARRIKSKMMLREESGQCENA